MLFLNVDESGWNLTLKIRHAHFLRFSTVVFVAECGHFDLEMSRPGCAALQLASTLGFFGPNAPNWAPFFDGWKASGATTNADAECADRAARHFPLWHEVTRYLSYDGTPGSGFHWADPVWYRQAMDASSRLLSQV